MLGATAMLAWLAAVLLPERPCNGDYLHCALPDQEPPKLPLYLLALSSL
jgi:hypothetical protein